MIRFLFLFAVVGALGCGGSTEPKVPAGIFDLVSVNGVHGGEFDPAEPCPTVYAGGYINFQGSNSVALSFDAYGYCNGPGNPTFNDLGTYAVSGSNSLSFAGFTHALVNGGTFNAARDTVQIDMRDVLHPERPKLGHFIFAK